MKFLRPKYERDKIVLRIPLYAGKFQKSFIFFKNPLTNRIVCAIILCVGYLGVAQLVARYLGVVEAASSSLVTQTNKRRFVRISFLLYMVVVFVTFGLTEAAHNFARFSLKKSGQKWFDHM